MDEEYKTFLREVCGRRVIAAFEEQNQEDYLTMIREFEVKKRKPNTAPGALVSINIPVALMREAEKQSGKNLQETLSATQCKYLTMGEIKYSAGKIRVPEIIFKELFKPSIEGILKEMRQLMATPGMGKVSHILLVGGFSDCQLIQEAIKENFPKEQYRVICPGDGELCVVKGAVLFGHKTDIISTRLSRYHYGVEEKVKWDPSIHPVDKLLKTEEGDFCKDTFSCIIKKGEQIHVGDTVFQHLFSPVEQQIQNHLELFISEDPDPPRFVTDSGCRKLGDIKFRMPMWKRRREQLVTLRISFECTELKAVVTDEVTGRVYVTKCNFLEKNIN